MRDAPIDPVDQALSELRWFGFSPRDIPELIAALMVLRWPVTDINKYLFEIEDALGLSAKNNQAERVAA